MNWLNLALALLSLVQWVASRLDEAKQEKLSEATLALSFMRKSNELIAKAKAARAAAERDAATGGLHESDGFRRD